MPDRGKKKPATWFSLQVPLTDVKRIAAETRTDIKIVKERLQQGVPEFLAGIEKALIEEANAYFKAKALAAKEADRDSTDKA